MRGRGSASLLLEGRVHFDQPQEIARALAQLNDTLKGEPQLNPFPLIFARSLRPFGMLIFIEGIAWFLLRQYRSLIQDYKTFVRIQLQRSNYLIALKAAATVEAGSPVADVIRAILSEDLTGRLSKEQTTEALETMKYREDAPILEALKELKELVKVKLSGSG